MTPFGDITREADRTTSARPVGSTRFSHDGRHLGRDTLEPIVSIRERVPRSRRSSFVAEALEEIRIFLRERGIAIDGPPFVIAHATGTCDLDLEVGWPVRTAAGKGRMAAGSISTHLARPDAERSGEPDFDHVV